MGQVVDNTTMKDRDKAQARAYTADQAQQATGQQVQGEVQGNRNAVLDRAMSEYASRGNGLGNPNAALQQGNQEAAQYTMIATEVGNNSRNPQEYAQKMIALAEAGKVSTEMLRSDPVIAEMIAAQNQAPVGLGQVR